MATKRKNTSSNVETETPVKTESNDIVDSFWVTIAKSKSGDKITETQAADGADGVLIKTFTQVGDQIANALSYIPNVMLMQHKADDTYKIVSTSDFKRYSDSHRRII